MNEPQIKLIGLDRQADLDLVQKFLFFLALKVLSLDRLGNLRLN